MTATYIFSEQVITMHKIVNGQRVELTAEEITQREAEEVQWADGAYDRAMVDLRSQA